MGLKQVKDPDRIIFLQEFTKQIILSLVREKESKEEIEIEKLKQKFVKPVESGEIFKKIIKRDFLIPSMMHRQPGPEVDRRKVLIHRESIPGVLSDRIKISSKEQLMQKKPVLRAEERVPQREIIQQPMQGQVSGGDVFKKVESLLRDPTIISIECPGPGRNILVKRYNQINLTRISLNAAEINAIIDDFSKKARIPLVGGILKAAVGNSVISAVVSEFAGSRFIINKITPYSILQRQF